MDWAMGETIEGGEILLDWMKSNGLIAANTCFQHRRKEKYTWVSPDGQYKNMIDYIIVRKRERREVRDSRSLVSADYDTDHQLVWMKMKGKSWNKPKKTQSKRKRDLNVLRDPEKRASFEERLKNKLSAEETTWVTLEKGIKEAIQEECPVKPRVAKPWITPECWKLMEDRAAERSKNPNSEEHRIAARKVKKALRKAKREWYANVLKEAEIAAERGDYKTIYKNIKQVTKTKCSKPGIGIKDANGALLYDKDAITQRWKDYCTNLFKADSDNVHRGDIERGEEEPEVMEVEIEAAIKKLKSEKAMGLDEVPAEALKAGGQTVIRALKIIIDNIWKTGEWPRQWVMSELVTLPKVPGTQECNKHRTVSLISHASKILLEILRRRLDYYLAPQISDEQFGFTRGKGTTEAILVARNLIQKVVAKQEDNQIWFLLVDYSKAFDTVHHEAIWSAMSEFGVPNHLTWLLKGLYDHATGVVRVEDEHTEEFRFEKGVRQGCLVSPLLFNMIGEKIMREVEERLEERSGKIVGGRSIWNIRYADDTTMVSRSREECSRMGEVLKDVSKTVGLEINKSKTQVMSVHGTGEVKIDNESITKVEKVKFLGSYLTEDGASTVDIKCRIGQAKAITNNMAEIWKSCDLSLKHKVRMAKACVWSVALYACETWTLRKQEQKMIEAFEMWLWRRILRVKWTEHKTNEWVIDKIGVREERTMLEEVKRRKVRKYGHWKRRGGSLVLASVEGDVEGRGRRGRRKMDWMSNVIEWEGGLERAHSKAWKRRSTALLGL